MRIKTDRVSLIANNLREAAGQTEAPIDVEACAKHVGAELTLENFEEDLSGILIKKGNRKIIAVNNAHSINRRRFTIGHEVGHLVLQHKGEVFVDQMVIKRDPMSSQAVDIQEIEANRFAAELLMPESLVIERVRRHEAEAPEESPLALSERLALEFGVSSQAMEFRLINLGFLIPR